jgi:hypothetical protein
MPLSFAGFSATAIIVMVIILTINQLAGKTRSDLNK